MAVARRAFDDRVLRDNAAAPRPFVILATMRRGRHTADGFRLRDAELGVSTRPRLSGASKKAARNSLSSAAIACGRLALSSAAQCVVGIAARADPPRSRWSWSGASVILPDGVRRPSAGGLISTRSGLSRWFEGANTLDRERDLGSGRNMGRTLRPEAKGLGAKRGRGADPTEADDSEHSPTRPADEASQAN